MIHTHVGEKPVAVVSGGTGFLGRAIVQQLVADGFVTVALYHTTPVVERELCVPTNAIEAAHAYKCNLADSAAVALTFAQIEKEIGPIAAAIHSAQSPIVRKKVTDLSPIEFKDQFNISVFGGFAFFKAAVSLMRPRNTGIIIGIGTSMLENHSLPGSSLGGYVSAKSALKGLLLEIAAELAHTHIRVYIVEPGFMPGGVNSDLPARLIEFMKESSPGGELLRPEDVAKTVSCLCDLEKPRAPFLSVIERPIS